MFGGFASNGVNITKLESYVHPQGFDVAQFYIDFEGHPENSSVKLALEEMKFFCKHLKILGVYEKSTFRKNSLIFKSLFGFFYNSVILARKV